MTFAYAVITAMVLAGCADHGQPSPSSTGPGPISPISSTTAPVQLPLPAKNETIPRTIELSQCTAFAATSEPPLPKADAPGHPPTGWEPKDPSAPFGYVSVQGYECNRISVGPFERAARILVDGHTNADIPASCMASLSGQHLSAIVSTILVNDTQLASYLQNTFGLPALAAEVQIDAQNNGALVERTWKWGEAGKPASQFTFYDDGQTQQWNRGDRFYWQRPTGIGILDVTYSQMVGPSVTNREGYGTMQPPMLFASMPNGLMVADTNYYPSLSGHGKFEFYKDQFCKQADSS